jgi:hypothetical protein
MKIILIITMALFCAPGLAADKTADQQRSRPTEPWDKKIADTLVSYPFEQWRKDMRSGDFSRDELKRIVTTTFNIVFTNRAKRQRYFEAISFEDQMLLAYFMHYCMPIKQVVHGVFGMNGVTVTYMSDEEIERAHHGLAMDLLRRLLVDKDPRVSTYFTTHAVSAMIPLDLMTDEEAKFIIDHFPKIESLFLRKTLCFALSDAYKLPSYNELTPDFKAALSKEMYATYFVKKGTAPPRQ